MANNIVSLSGDKVDFCDPIRQDFLAFAAEIYDGFKTGNGAEPTAFIVTMLSDEGVYNSYWLGKHSALPSSVFLSLAITGLTAAFIKGEMPYQKPEDD